MADRYWVGGSGTWNTTNTANWSATSGGTSGASVPTASDNVFINNLSGNAATVTVSGVVNCLNLDLTGFNGTFTGNSSQNVNVYGGLVLSSHINFNWVSGPSLTFSATSGNYTVVTNGKTLDSQVYFGLTASTATWALGDALYMSNRNLFVSRGTFDTAGYALSAGALFSNSFGPTRAIYLRSSTVYLDSTAGNATSVVDFISSTSPLTGFTFDAGTSTITGVLQGTATNFKGGNNTFNNVNLTVSSESNIFQGITVFNNLSLTATGTTNVKTISIDTGNSITVNGVFSSSSNSSGAKRILLKATVLGTAQTVSLNGSTNLTDIDFRDITVNGTATPISGTRLGDCGGNSGITFPTAKTVYLVSSNSANSWTDGSIWSSSTSSADVSPTQFPLAQDSVVIGNYSGPASCTLMILYNSYYVASIDASARTLALTINAFALTITNGLILGSGVSMSSTTATLLFINRSSSDFVLNTNGRTLGGFAKLDIYMLGSGALTPVSSATISGGVDVTLYAGTLNIGASQIFTCGSFASSSATRPRSLVFGTGASIKLAPNIARTNLLDISNGTNLTVSGRPKISVTFASSASPGSLIWSATTGIDQTNPVDVSLLSGTYSAATVLGQIAVLGSLDFTGFSGQWSWSASVALNLYGSLKLSSGMSLVASAPLTFAGTGPGLSIDLVGKTIPGDIIFATQSTSDTYNFTSAFRSSGYLVFKVGNVSTGNWLINAACFQFDTGPAKTIYFGTSVVTLSSTPFLWILDNNTTLSASSATFNITQAASNLIVDFGTDQIYGTVSINDITVATKVSLLHSGSLTQINKLVVKGVSTSNTVREYIQSADGTFIIGQLDTSFVGTSSPIVYKSSVEGTRATLLLQAATTVLEDITFRDCDISHLGNNPTITRVGDGGNNAVTGFTFPAARTLYWVGSTSYWTNSNWSLTAGGSTTGVDYPLPQDTAVFTNTGVGAFSVPDRLLVGSIDCSARTSSLQMQMPSAFAVGDVVLGSAVYGSLGIAPPISTIKNLSGTSTAINVIQNGSGSVNLVGNVNTGTGNYTLSLGSLGTNGYVLSCNTFLSSGTASRQINGTSGGRIDVASASGSVIDFTTSTNLGFFASPTFRLTGASTSGQTRTVSTPTSGTATYSLEVTAGAGTLSISSATSRFYNLDLSGFSGTLNPTAAQTLTIYGQTLSLSSALTFGANVTSFTLVTTTGLTTNLTTSGEVLPGSLSVSGAGNLKLLDACAVTSAVTLSSSVGLDLNSYTLTAATFSASSGAPTIAFGNSGAIVLNSTAAGTLFTTTSTTIFTGSREVRIVGNTPSGTAQSIVGNTAAVSSAAPNLRVTSGAATVTIGGQWNNIDFTGFSGVWTNSSATVYGDLTLSAGMLVTATASSLTFGGSTVAGATWLNQSVSISLAGKSTDMPITFNRGIGNTAVLGSNLTAGSTRTLTLTSGSINLNGYAVTSGLFSSSNSTARAIDFGSTGTITVNGTGTVWSTPTTTGMSCSGNRVVNISNATATATTVSPGALGELNCLSFNINAGTYALTITASSDIRSLDFTGFSGSFTIPILSVYGSWKFSTGMTVTGSGALSFASTSGNHTVTSSGKSFGASAPTFGASGASVATWSLLDALTTTGAVTLTSGTFTTNNYNVTATVLSSSNTNVRAINLGSSTLTLSASSCVSLTTSTNLAFDAGTSNIICSYPSGNVQFFGGSLTFYNVSFTGTIEGIVTLNGSNTFNNLSVSGITTGAGVKTLSLGLDQVVNGILNLTPGTNATMRTFVRGSSNIGIQSTLTCAAVSTLQDVDFMDIGISGNAVTAGNISGTRLGNGGGNTGITFTTPKTVYCRATTASNWSSTTGWSATIGGTADITQFPLAQDTVVFPSATYPATATTITLDKSYLIGTVDMSGRTTNTMTLATGTTTPIILGNWINGTGTTLSGTGTLTFAGRNTQGLTTASRTFTQNITLYSPGGTLNITGTLANGSSVLTITQGTFNTNNVNVTTTAINSTSSLTRSLNFGSSTVTVSGSGINFGTSGGLAFSAGTSSINLSSVSAPTVSGNNQNFNNISFTAPNLSSAGALDNIASISNLSVAARTTAGINQIAVTSNITVTGTLTLSGSTGAHMRTFLRSNTVGTQRTLTCNSVAALTNIDFRDIAITGSAVSGGSLIGTLLGDCKGNSNITFDSPKTVYWSSTQTSWGVTATPTFSLTLGGAASHSAFPLAQDTAVIGASSPASGSTITMFAAYNIGTIDMSARTTNTNTFAFSVSPTVYGDIITGTGTTYTGATGFIFSGRTIQNFTSSGKTYTGIISINSPGGSLRLMDAMTTNGGFGTLTAGTLDCNGYSLTFSAGGITGSGTASKTVAFGNGSAITLTASSTNIFNFSSGGLSVTGTGTISANGSTAKSLNFGTGVTAQDVTINQGGVGTLTIIGSNKFANLTNTAIGRIEFSGGSTNEFTNFSINGASGNLLQLGSTNTTPAILKKPDAWNIGLNSTDSGNNTGLSFSGTSPNYLNVSYINAQILSAVLSSIYYSALNISSIYYGSMPVSEIYYGAIKVF